MRRITAAFALTAAALGAMSAPAAADDRDGLLGLGDAQEFAQTVLSSGGPSVSGGLQLNSDAV
ncbi:hypothetical protein ACFWTE_11845 [Nocardiopsis sp. NPDC058631]|uniref:hypothetical protein n=1 Tax=Nocardiopsis sp. NPDC058631 TaxID=3346566 RepID=UPI003660A11C